MPYLTNQEYIDRIGLAETIRITDEDQSGAVDPVKVTDAIFDAGEFADSYIATKYTLPLPFVPEIVKGIVVALAREILHRTRPTDAVTAQADRARAQLKDIAAGRASIPVPDGSEAPSELPAGLTVTSNDARGRLFTDAALCDFAGFGGYRGRLPFDGPCG